MWLWVNCKLPQWPSPKTCFSSDPPSIRCKNFTDDYGYSGAVFPCFYSKKNKTVVMTSYNRDTQVNTIIHYFVVPFIITVMSSVGICVIHCNCSCKKERPKYRRPRIENIRSVMFSVMFWYFECIRRNTICFWGRSIFCQIHWHFA